jgi:O-antigen ligase
MRQTFALWAWLIIALIGFTIINPSSGGDILAFLLIALIVLHKLFGERAILLFLAVRPTIDGLRDYNFFILGSVSFNINAALSLLLAGWTAYFFIKNWSYWKGIPARYPWLIFIAWCAATFLYSFDTSSTVTETLKVANLFGLFGVCNVLRRKEGEKFTGVFYLSLIIASATPLLLATYQLISHTGMTIDGVQNRIFGTFAHPNLLATYTVLLFIIFADYTYRFQLRLEKKNRIDQFIGPINQFFRRFSARTTQEVHTFTPYLFIFLAAIIAATYTRVAWIGLAAFILGICFFYYEKIFLYVVGGTILFYLLFYPLNTWLGYTYNINLQSNSLVARLTARNEDADSIQWRADIANKIIPLFEARPYLGYGYGSFSKVWDYNKGVENLFDNTSEAHNDYLKVAFETGIIGLFFYLSIFGTLLYHEFRTLLQGRWIHYSFILSILIYLIMSLSDNMLHHTPVIWWLWAVWGYWVWV